MVEFPSLIPYLTPEELVAFSHGVPLDKYSTRAQQMALVTAASRVADNAVGGGYSFAAHTVREEFHRVNESDALRWHTRQQPIRAITELAIMPGTLAAGVRGKYPIATLPAEATPSPDILPTVFGNVNVERDMDAVTFGSLQLVIGGAAVYFSVIEPKLLIAYTAGYDAGWLYLSGTAPAHPPTATLGGLIQQPVGGPPVGVDIGTHVYAASYTAYDTETPISAVSAAVTVTASGQMVNLSALPTAPAGAQGTPLVTGRRIYRSRANTAGPLYYLVTIADNTTTTFIDAVPDVALGFVAGGVLTSTNRVGTPSAPDGLVQPVPEGLREATRYIAADIASEANRGGAFGLQSETRGAVSWERIRIGRTVIPLPAAEMLQGIRNDAWVGGTSVD